MNAHTQPMFRIAMSDGPETLRAAQRLRYDVFVDELGAGGALVDHDKRLEIDAYDDFSDHMLLFDDTADRLVGVYRLIRSEHAQQADGFYSETEYDLAPLEQSGRRLLELGRSCLHAEYRGGAAMYHLWTGLAAYVAQHDIEILFGVASFHGTDVQALAAPLSLLHHRHLAPADIRPVAKAPQGVAMDLMREASIDRRKAMVKIPALIKAYLRLGGVVGEGAWIDQTFNTTDVCLVMDTAAMNARQRQIYAGAL